MTTMHPAHMCLTVILFVFVSFPVFGQDAASSLSPQATYDSANVVVNGQVLFKVIGVSSSPAKKRAKRIANRIEALAEDPTFDPENIAIRVEDDRTLLVAGDHRIMTIRNLDAMGEGVNRRTLADIYQKKIKA